MVLITEKNKPHYELKELKCLIQKGKYIITRTAQKGAVQIGLSAEEIRQIVLGLRNQDFYKSMTSYKNHKLWQDVYKPMAFIQEEYIELYIKLQKSVEEKCVIISFKQAED